MTGSFNTAVGHEALSTNSAGSYNIALGYNAGSFPAGGDNNIYIGNRGSSGPGSNAIHIGGVGIHTATFIAGIYGATASGGTAVYLNSSGQLGTVTSSARFKKNIQSMDGASDVLLALHPVTFRYKRELDPENIPQFGLVAEEVEKVNPDLVVRDADGKPYTVRYEAVNAMLLNEFLKEHKKVEEQETAISQLKSAAAKQEASIAKQQKQIEALTAGLQRVSAQVEMSRLRRKWPSIISKAAARITIVHPRR
jgi:uncharacterized coiled-coil protein SlyX